MTTVSAAHFWRRVGRAIGLVLLLGLLGGIGTSPAAYGQVTDDTVQTDTSRGGTPVPPAGLEPVRPGDGAAPDTGKTDRAVVQADSLSTFTQDGERVQELFGNVFVRQDTTRLRSSYALRYLNRDDLLFTGDVVIYERGDTLTADTVRYNKRTQVGRARGNVRLTDGDVVVRAPRAVYYTNEKHAVFPDSITLVDSSRVLRAEEGEYWSDEQRAEFGGQVRLTDPETDLESDSLTYFRDEERSIARGDVFIERTGGEEGAEADTTTRTYLFGEWVDNQQQIRYSRVEGRALLVRVRRDSAGAPEDTLIVRAHQLEARRTDTHRRLVAVDSVRVWQSDMSAVADSAVYDRVIATGPRDTTAAPLPPPSGTEASDDTSGAPQPDSADALKGVPESLDGPPQEQLPAAPSDTTDDAPPTAPDTSADSVAIAEGDPPPDTTQRTVPDTSIADSVRAQRSGPPGPGGTGPATGVPPDSTVKWTTPTAQDSSQLPLEETRLYQSPMTWFERAQVWGDSIRVRARQRNLDTVFVRGAAFAAQEDSTTNRIQQLKGKTITAFFRSDSLKRIVARPNAQAIRFIKNDDGSLGGAARVSGDSIILHFRHQSVRRVSVLGGTEGTYYRRPKDIPDPFELEGFQWVPEQRPTRAALLDEDRVRRRLDVNVTPRPALAQEDTTRSGAPPVAPGVGSQSGAQGRSPGKSPYGPGGGRSSPSRPDSTTIPPDSIRVQPDTVGGARTPPVPDSTSSDSTKSEQ